jgi:hypothetical protein
LTGALQARLATFDRRGDPFPRDPRGLAFRNLVFQKRDRDAHLPCPRQCRVDPVLRRLHLRDRHVGARHTQCDGRRNRDLHLPSSAHFFFIPV